MKLNVLEGDHIFRRYHLDLFDYRLKYLLSFQRPDIDNPYIKGEQISSNKGHESFPGLLIFELKKRLKMKCR
jgi:hypothetical protein